MKLKQFAPKVGGILGAPLDLPMDCLIPYSIVNYCNTTYLPKGLMEMVAYCL